MNHPDHSAVDVEEMRQWLAAYKEQKGLSWDRLGAAVGIPGGTLQPFCKATYAGNNGRVATAVFRFRQTSQAREDRAIGIPVDPGYFETPTSLRLEGLLDVAQSLGRITIAATGPGTGKTKTVQNYQACHANVWVATMSESTRTLNQMIWEVSLAIGEPIRFQHSPAAARAIKEKVRGRGGVIVIDEANALATDAIEELRSWHDATGVGICLLGNEELLARIEGGPRRDAFARLNSRIAQRHSQNLPLEGDVIAFCDAWEITDPGMRKMLTTIALTPASGGLRECAMIIEAGSMLAMLDGQPLNLAYLRDAQSTRATRAIRT